MSKFVESLEGRRLMSAAPIVAVTGTTLSFTESGDYTFEAVPSRDPKVKVRLDGGRSTLLSKMQFDTIAALQIGAGAHVNLDVAELTGRTVSGAGKLNVTGVTFLGADANVNAAGKGNFEPSTDLKTLIESDFMLGTNAGYENNVASALDHVEVNGSTADAIKVTWDYLDDNYVALNNYYAFSPNVAFVRLGIEYADYLGAGGAALTHVVAKYNTDLNLNGRADRNQSMHDNLLGNFNPVDLQSRLGGSPALYAAILAQIPTDLQTRGVYSGNDSAYGSAAHLAIIAFDEAKGWDREDANLLTP